MGGWASCGSDSQGRPIGYSYEATCDHPGCEVEIDRGLGYACGGEHGDTEVSCEKYFCGHHLDLWCEDWETGKHHWVCRECYDLLEKSREDDAVWELISEKSRGKKRPYLGGLVTYAEFREGASLSGSSTSSDGGKT